MKKSRKQMRMILTGAILLFLYSIEALLLAKDLGLYQTALQAGLVDSMEMYISIHMMRYALHILVPMLVCVAIFLSKREPNRVGRGIYSLLLLMGMALRLLEGAFWSPFYYTSVLLYLLLLYFLNRREKSPASEAKT